jgi:hydroxymethylglutaryl-CoA lyase
MLRFREVLDRALADGVSVRGYVSVVLGCPYAGEVALADVVRVASALHRAGCYEISLGDTIGVGTPARARTMLQAVAQEVPMEALAVHFHDTRGQALANIYACVDAGVRVIDAAIAGLGGCPYAHGASGNVATEDVVYMLEGMGLRTGVDLPRLVETGRWISTVLGRDTQSRVGRAAA